MSIETRIIYRDSAVNVSEVVKVINGMAVLSEIPDMRSHVRIDGYTEVYIENTDYLKNDEFTVNYNNGIVHFGNNIQDDSYVSATYKGRGYIMYPASRIYTEDENGNIKTFKDTVEDVQALIDFINNNVNAVTSINGKTGVVTLGATDVGAVPSERYNSDKSVSDNKISQLESKTSVLESDVADVKEDITEIRDSISAIGSNQTIATLKTDVDNLKITSTTVQNEIQAIKNNANVMGRNIAQNSLDILNIEQSIADVNEDLAELKGSVGGVGTHTHVEADIIDLDKYTKQETSNLIDTKIADHNHDSRYALIEHSHNADEIDGISEIVDISVLKSAFSQTMSKFLEMQTRGITGIPFVELFYNSSEISTPFKPYAYNAEIKEAVTLGENKVVKVDNVEGFSVGMTVCLHGNSALTDVDAKILNVDTTANTITLDKINSSYVVGDRITTFNASFNRENNSYVLGNKTTYVNGQKFDNSTNNTKEVLDTGLIVALDKSKILVNLLRDNSVQPSVYAIEAYRKTDSPTSSWTKIINYEASSAEYIDSLALVRNEQEVEIVFQVKDRVFGSLQIESIKFNPATVTTTDTLGTSIVTDNTGKRMIQGNMESINSTNGVSVIARSDNRIITGKSNILVLTKPEFGTEWSERIVHTAINQTKSPRLSEYDDNILITFLELNNSVGGYSDVYYAQYNGLTWSESKLVRKFDFDIESYTSVLDKNGNINIYVLDKDNGIVYHSQKSPNGEVWTNRSLIINADQITSTKNANGDIYIIGSKYDLAEDKTTIRYYNVSGETISEEIVNTDDKTGRIKYLNSVYTQDKMFSIPLLSISYQDNTVETKGFNYTSKTDIPLTESVATFLYESDNVDFFEKIYLTTIAQGDFSLDVAIVGDTGVQEYVKDFITELDPYEKEKLLEPSNEGDKMLLRFRFKEEIEGVYGVIDNNIDFTSSIEELQGKVEVLETTAENQTAQMAQLFQSVSSGKTLIATAITDKGIVVAPTAPFQEMANAIALISTGETNVPNAPTGISVAFEYNLDVKISWSNSAYLGEESSIEGFNIYINGQKENTEIIRDNENNVLKYNYVMDKHRYQSICATSFPRITITAVSKTGLESKHSTPLSTLVNGYNGVNVNLKIVRDVSVSYDSFGRAIISWNWNATYDYYDDNVTGFVIKTYDYTTNKLIKVETMDKSDYYNEDTQKYNFEIFGDKKDVYKYKRLYCTVHKYYTSPYTESNGSPRLEYGFFDNYDPVENMVVNYDSQGILVTWDSYTKFEPTGYFIAVEWVKDGVRYFKSNNNAPITNGAMPPIDSLGIGALSNDTTSYSFPSQYIFNETEYKFALYAVGSNPYKYSRREEKKINYAVAYDVTEDIIYNPLDSNYADISKLKFAGDWYVDTNENIYRSKEITDNETSSASLNMNLEEKTKVFIEYGVESEAGYDHLGIYLNGERILYESGEKEGFIQFEIEPGNNKQLKLQYSKDYTGYVGKDMGYIKSIYVLKESSPLLPSPVSNLSVERGIETADITFDTGNTELSNSFLIEVIDKDTNVKRASYTHNSIDETTTYTVGNLIPDRNYIVKVCRIGTISTTNIYSTEQSIEFKTLPLEDGTSPLTIAVVSRNKEDIYSMSMPNMLKITKGVYVDTYNQAEVTENNLLQYDIIVAHNTSPDQSSNTTLTSYDMLKMYMLRHSKPLLITGTVMEYINYVPQTNSESFAGYLGIIDLEIYNRYFSGQINVLQHKNTITKNYQGLLRAYDGESNAYIGAERFYGQSLMKINNTTYPYTLLGILEKGSVSNTGEVMNAHIVYAPLLQSLNYVISSSFLEAYIPRILNWLTSEHNPPSKPKGLTSTTNPDGTIKVSWTPNAELDVKGYYVYLEGQQYTGLMTDTELILGGLIINKNYRLQVIAVDNDENESDLSDPLIVNIAFDVVPPKAPTNVRYVERDKMIELYWDKNSEFDFNGYNVYVDGVKHNSSVIKTPNYVIKGLANNRSYFVEITSVDINMIESLSVESFNLTPRELKWRMLDNDMIRLYPKNDTENVFPIYNRRSATTYVQFNWESRADRTTIYGDRYDSNGNYVDTVTHTGSTTSNFTIHAQGKIHLYLASGVAPNVVKITDSDSFNDLEFSKNVEYPNPTPKNLRITNQDEKVLLQWDSSGELYCQGYHVYVDGTRVTTDLVTGTSYAIGLLNNYQSYDVVIKGVTQSGRETSQINSQSNTYEVMPRDITAPFPVQDSSIVVKALSQSAQVSWGEAFDNTRGDGVIGYNVYVNGSKNNVDPIVDTNYLITTGLTNGYRAGITVTAVDKNGNESIRSATKVFTPREEEWVKPISDITVSNVDFANVNVSWNVVENSFPIERYEVILKDSSSKIIKTTMATDKNIAISELVENTSYTVEVVAVRVVGSETYKSEAVSKEFTTAEDPIMPKNVVLQYTKDSIRVIWDTVSSIAGYNVYVDGVRHNVGLLPLTEYTITNLTEGVKYEIRVTSQLANGSESSKTKPLYETPRGTTPPNPLQDFELTNSYNCFYVNLKQDRLYDDLSTYDYAPTQAQIDDFINNYNATYNNRLYYVTYISKGSKYLQLFKLSSYDRDFMIRNDDTIKLNTLSTDSSQTIYDLRYDGTRGNNNHSATSTQLTRTEDAVTFIEARKSGSYTGVNFVPENVIGYNVYVDGVKNNSTPISIKNDTYRIKVKDAEITRQYKVEITLVDKGGLESSPCEKTYSPTPLKKSEVKVGVFLYDYDATGSEIINSYTFSDLNKAGWKWQYYIEDVKPNYKNYDIIIMSNWRDDEETRNWAIEMIENGTNVLVGKYQIANDGLLVDKLGIYEGTYTHHVNASNQKHVVTTRENQYHPIVDILPKDFVFYRRYYDYMTATRVLGKVIGHRENYPYRVTAMLVDKGITSFTGVKINGRLLYSGFFASNYSYAWNEGTGAYGETEWWNTCLEWLAGKDPQIPSTPTGLELKYGEKIITASWDINTTDADMKGFNLYLDGTLWNTSHGSIQNIDTSNGKVVVTIDKTKQNTGTALVNGQQYRVKVSAVDLWNNESKHSEEKVMSPKQMIPPSMPNELRAMPYENSVVVSWNHSPEDDLVGYNVYVNNVKHNQELVQTNTYEVSGLNVDTEYKVEIKSIDVDDLESNALEPIYITTISTPESYLADLSQYDEKPSLNDIRKFEMQNYDKLIYFIEIVSASIKKLYVVAYEKELNFVHNVNSPNLELIPVDSEGMNFKTLHVLRQYDVEGNSIIDTNVRIDLNASLHNGVSSYSIVQVIHEKVKPSAPTDVASSFTWDETLGSGEAIVTWTPNDEFDKVIGYNVYLDGILVNTDSYITGNTYTITGLTDRYIEEYVTVVAIDEYHMRSNSSERIGAKNLTYSNQIQTGRMYSTSSTETTSWDGSTFGTAISVSENVVLEYIEAYTYSSVSGKTLKPVVMEDGVFINLCENEPIKTVNTGGSWTYDMFTLNKPVTLEKGKTYLIGYEGRSNGGSASFQFGNISTNPQVFSGTINGVSKNVNLTTVNKFGNATGGSGYGIFYTSMNNKPYSSGTVWNHYSGRQGLRTSLGFKLVEQV